MQSERHGATGDLGGWSICAGHQLPVMVEGAAELGAWSGCGGVAGLGRGEAVIGAAGGRNRAVCILDVKLGRVADSEV